MHGVAIGKEFRFEAAHRLIRHDGKCQNLHGHSYKVEISVHALEVQPNTVGPDDFAELNPQAGMLMDFGVLKQWWKPLEELFDHRTILEKGDVCIEALTSVGQRVVVLEVPPTAENLANHLQISALQRLFDLTGIENMTVTVKVWETETSWAQA